MAADIGYGEDKIPSLKVQPLSLHPDLHNIATPSEFENDCGMINKTRLELLKQLRTGGKAIKNLYWAIDSNWHNTHYHLGVLASVGFVEGEHSIVRGVKKSRETTIYRLTDKGFRALHFFGVESN